MSTAWSQERPHGVYARREGDYLFLGNRHLERVFRLSGDVVRTVEFANRVSGRTPASHETAEFVLALSGVLEGELASPDFRLVDIDVADQAGDALRVTFSLACRRAPELQVDLSAEAYPDATFQRKWLDIRWDGDGEVVVERVDVEVPVFGWWNVANPAHSGYGQPIFAGDLYMGLEYPAGETSSAFVRHFPGRPARGGVRSKSAVWGVAASPAQTRAAFLDDYLTTLTPRRPEPFVIYNLLGVGDPVGIPEERELVAWVARIAASAEEAGFRIDSFAVDDRWQDETTVWQPAPRRFPNGLGPLADACRAVGGRLGLWMSLAGYTLDTRWGRQEGLEVTKDGDRSAGGHYCLAGPNYLARLKGVLSDYIEREGVNYFKFDYNDFGCDDPTHGHPVGRAGREAQIDGFLDVLAHVKRTAPETFVAITSGMWLSPWWLPSADAVWLGGNDLGIVEEVPCLTPHDSAITYRDVILHDDYAVKQYAFPHTALMTHGFWVERGAPFSRFKDDIIMTLGRGVAKWEILTAPQALDSKRYTFLGRAIRWGRANWDLLCRTRLILGDPRRGEVYGYAHTGEGATLLFLRNPALESRIVELGAETLGLPTAVEVDGHGAPQAREIYPVDSELDWDGAALLSVEVLGGQCRCLAIVWDAALLDRVRL